MNKGLVSVLSLLAGGIVGAGAVGKIGGDKAGKIQEMSDKHLVLFRMMNQWVRVKQEGKNLSSYFEKQGYKKIAIYGMSYAGETLVNELKDSGIRVEYGIDQKKGIYSYVDVLSADQPLPEVDAVVVTAITFFNEIEEILKEKVTCPVISLQDALYEV